MCIWEILCAVFFEKKSMQWYMHTHIIMQTEPIESPKDSNLYFYFLMLKEIMLIQLIYWILAWLLKLSLNKGYVKAIILLLEYNII